MLKVIIYTVSGNPVLMLPADSTPGAVRQAVEEKFGWLGIGLPHSWLGFLV